MEKMIYKTKYVNLKQKYLTDMDAAFRVGFEQGLKQGQMDAQAQQMQMQQQQAAQQAQMMQQAQGGQPGAEQPGMEGAPQGEQMPPEMGGEMPPQEGAPTEEMGQEPGMEEMAPPGELDSKIAELEDLLQRGEKPKILDLRKAVNELATLRKQQISALSKNNKKVETAQRSLVKGILNKWAEESKSVTEDLDKLLENEGIKL